MQRAKYLAIAVAMSFAPAATGQDQRRIAVFARDLAYGFCPKLLNGSEKVLDNPSLKTLGFVSQPDKVERQGLTIEILHATRPDGTVLVGGASEKVCQVQVIGAKADAALQQFHEGLSGLDLHFEADPENSKTFPNGADVETVVAHPTASTAIRVQFIKASLRGEPLGGFQIFAMDK